MTLALLFPGQGSQAVGMGQALSEAFPCARRTFEEAGGALGERLSRVIFDGPVDELKRTRNTQPAILTVSIAALRALEERAGPTSPALVAGHSLGEYSALVAAGAMSFADAVRSVRARGGFMQDAVPEGEGAMAAVLGLDAESITRVVNESAASAYVAVANYNGPDQTVIAGTRAGVELATTALKAAGAKRVMPLPVSAPFHCSLMAPVKPQLDAVLAQVTFSAARVPVVTNVEAAPNSAAARVREILVSQVTAPVRFTDIVLRMMRDGVDAFVEVGPGKVLSGIVKRMAKEATIRNVEDPASLDATLGVLR
jgi:[acyl-carrier-protein] S-malonyltransferase